MKEYSRFFWVGLVLWVLLIEVGCSGVTPVQKTAARFSSDGDVINGWYWLRDASFEQVAEWVFEGIPRGTRDLVFEFEVLATDRMNGAPGVDARFFVSYGIPSMGTMGGLIVGTQEVVLQHVSEAEDPLGHTCRGKVRIPREHLENVAAIWIRAHRFPGPFLPGESPSTVHVAFRAESVVLLF